MSAFFYVMTKSMFTFWEAISLNKFENTSIQLGQC